MSPQLHKHPSLTPCPGDNVLVGDFLHIGSFHTLELQQCLQRLVNDKPPEVEALRCEIALLGYLCQPHACVTEVGTIIDISLTMP